MLKAASDLALPMVGVGLLYEQGYFHQRLDLAGWQHEYWINTDSNGCPPSSHRRRRRTADHRLVLRGRTVHIQIWRIDVGRVPLYLLDTDREDNHPIDRWITAQLYIGDRHRASPSMPCSGSAVCALWRRSGCARGWCI